MADSDTGTLAGGAFHIDVGHPLPDAGGGLPAFAASDRRGGRGRLMAIRLDRFAPARIRALQGLAGRIEGLLTPLGHGAGPPSGGQAAWYVVCPEPPGPPVSASLRPWPESTLIAQVLRPMADVLDALQARGMTHRAIRPNNVFQAGPNRPVVLGAAWAAPPAMHQPPVFETAHSALCHPAGRGDGRIADDVYALGVLLVTLALGRVPMEGLDETTIAHRKLEMGDFAAIAGGERLPPILADILRGMLAEDPDHRPPPSLLRDPVSARGRRVASRPPARAPRPVRLGALPIWNARTLALGMALAPDQAMESMLNGTITSWLRRGLGESGLAVKLEEMVRQHSHDPPADKSLAQATMVMRAVAAADPAMPLCWRGLAFFPDGLAPLLAASFAGDPALTVKLREIVANESEGTWAGMKDDRTPVAVARLEARQRRAILQAAEPAGGLPRLAYTLNSLLPCASPLLAGRWIAHLADLPPALNEIAAADPGTGLLDNHIAAFIAARSERWLEQEVKALPAGGTAADRALAVIRLLSLLQSRCHPGPLTGLAAWAATLARPLVARWHNLERRAAIERDVQALAEAGQLPAMLHVLDDRDARTADQEGLRAARDGLARLDSELRDIAEGGPARAAVAARLGQEIAAGVGLAAIAATLILAALG